MRNIGPIILVEDPFIRNYLRFVLARRGYSVMECDSVRACEVVNTEGSATVITNNPEPFLPYSSRLSLIYLSTAPDMELASKFPDCRTLRKPFQPDELLIAIEALATHP